MKTIKKHLRIVALILVVIMLLQSCTVYKKTSITLNQAVQNESKVKVKTKSENLKFNRIGIENGNYYGVKKIQGEMIKIPLDIKTVMSVKEKNESASTIATVLVVTGSVIAIIVGAFLISGGPDIGLSWEYP